MCKSNSKYGDDTEVYNFCIYLFLSNYDFIFLIKSYNIIVKIFVQELVIKTKKIKINILILKQCILV